MSALDPKTDIAPTCGQRLAATITRRFRDPYHSSAISPRLGGLLWRKQSRDDHAAPTDVCFCCPAACGKLAFYPSARADHSPNLAVSNNSFWIGLSVALGVRFSDSVKSGVL